MNADAIGAIGHSFGAYNAYFLAPFDARVKAIVASCGAVRSRVTMMLPIGDY